MTELPPEAGPPRREVRPGDRFEVQVGAVAHGGHCVARAPDGRVVFVRHALPGERVVAEVTEVAPRFLRADAAQVLDRSDERVEAPCPYAGPGRCGGCDFQHVSLPAQRRLLAEVVREQLTRLGGIDPAGADDESRLVRRLAVEPVPGDRDGLAWRTRVRFSSTRSGRLGLLRHRSHQVVEVDRCLIAADRVADVLDHTWPGSRSVESVVSAHGERLAVVEPAARPTGRLRLPSAGLDGAVSTNGDRLSGRTYVREQALGREWRVTGSGFWQVHPGAAEALSGAAVDLLAPRAGERALDLFSGVGLFAAALADRVGPAGSVIAVEGDQRAVRDARRNLHDVPHVRIVEGPVGRVLRDGSWAEATGTEAVDLVLLDPPRTGARAEVVRAITGLRPRAVAYVACDPAALGRDVRMFREQGYRLAGLRAFDIFPMTHHVECVALLTA